MSEEKYTNYNQTPDIQIHKSSSNIHQTVDPSKKITLAQAKTLNAVQYKLQQIVRNSKLSVQQFHKNHQGNLTIDMPAHEFRRLINCESRNMTHLRQVISEIKDLSATWDTLTPDSKGEIGFINLFIAANYSDATFTFKIPEETTRLLVSENPAAVIDVLTVAQLSSKYAVFFNDMLEEWSYKTSSDDFQIVISDDDLRNLMKIPFKMSGKDRVYSYPQPGILKRKVIDPAVSEINEANLRFLVRKFTNKKSNGVVHWIFDVVSKKTMIIHQFASKNTVEINDIRHDLRQLKLSEDAIRTYIDALASDYDLEYIRYNIEIVQDQVKRNKAGNPGGLFRACMDRNKETFEPIWEDKKIQRDLDAELKKREYEKNLKEQLDRHTEEFIKIKTESLIEAVLESDSLKALHVVDFKAYLSKIPLKSSKDLIRVLDSSGLLNSIIKDHIFTDYLTNFVRKNLDPDDLQYFIKSKGTRLSL